LNAQGLNWLMTVANVRVHGTTCRRPVDLLAMEKLTDVRTIVAYRVSDKGSRKVDTSGFVRWGGSRYSVPPSHSGKRVLVEQGEQRITIRCDDLIIAEHEQAPRVGASVAAAEHVAELWKLSLAQPEPPRRRWEVTFQDGVATVPLTTYEEVVQ